jgi:hypothetical protein
MLDENARRRAKKLLTMPKFSVWYNQLLSITTIMSRHNTFRRTQGHQNIKLQLTSFFLLI